MGVSACQQEKTSKQYFEESPEIEIARKAVLAFQKGDAETYRSCYTDTVKIWQNQYFSRHPGKTISEQLEILETIKATTEYTKYIGDDIIILGRIIPTILI